MNKKIIYLIGAIAGVAAVSILTSKDPSVNPVTEIKSEALPVNGLVDVTASTTAAAAAVSTPATNTDAAPMPENTGMPVGGDELPAGAEVAPGQTDGAEDMNDDEVVPPSEGL